MNMALIASSSTDIKFHSWLEGTLHQTYYLPNSSNGYVKTISWGKDGTWMVVVPNSGYAEILSIKENVKALVKIKDIHQPTCAIFPNTTKKFVALGTYSGQVLIYDVKCKSVKKRFPRASSWIQSIACNANDTHFASATSAGDILVYNITTTNLSASYRIPNCNSSTVLSFHRTKRNLLAAGAEEGVVAVWDINTNERKASFQAHYAPVTDVALSPMRSDLVVSVGKDRQFTFYDVQNKKNVIQMEVPSSMLALDFSECGLYIGMGSQNGHIVIYDMRNLAKPVNGFPAHEGRRITQIAFQKNVKQKGEESSCTLIEENPYLSEGAEEDRNSPQNNSYFSYNNQEVTFTVREEPHGNSEDVEDSFMVALGNLNNSTATTPQRENCAGRLSDPMGSSNPHSGQKSSEKRLSLMRESIRKTPASVGKQISSTPKYLTAELPVTEESPIMAPSASSPNLVDIKKAISEIVQEELGNLKLDIRHEIMDSMSQTRRQFFDLQMFLVKEFINVENTVCRASGVTVEEYLGDSQIIQDNNRLIQDNNRLRQEIEHLKEKIVEQDGPSNY